MINSDKLKEIGTYRDSDIHINFGNFLFQKTYVHDNYGDERFLDGLL